MFDDDGSYGWIVDRDHLFRGQSWERDDKGTMGPRGVPDTLVKDLKSGEGTRWKAYDDDGNLYYTGRIVGDYDGFEPLEDFAMPNAGAVTIKYLEDGQWRTL